jgi:hypothetical protein
MTNTTSVYGKTKKLLQGNRKGQKSLEMIIGLVILLVVAAVVISLFLDVFQQPSVGQDTVAKEKITNECTKMCDNWKQLSGTKSRSAAKKYCTKNFVYDANDDGNTRQVVEQGYDSYCEDGVHCFNIHSCQSSRQELDYEKCAELLCDYFENDLEADPVARIEAHFVPGASDSNDNTNIGSCDLAGLEGPGGAITTWYTEYFQGPACPPGS